MGPKKLNLGCGTDVKPGWVNLDSASLPGVDVVHDIEKLPFPFADNSFDEILCQDILEHIDYLPVLKELHRILASGGTLTVRVPHFTSRNTYLDPTHKKAFSIETFDFFTKHSLWHARRPYYFDFAFSSSVKKILFERSSRIFFYNRFIERFVNKSPKRQSVYELTGLSRLFPAQNIVVMLVK